MPNVCPNCHIVLRLGGNNAVAYCVAPVITLDDGNRLSRELRCEFLATIVEFNVGDVACVPIVSMGLPMFQNCGWMIWEERVFISVYVGRLWFRDCSFSNI